MKEGAAGQREAMRFGDLTYPEIKDRIERGALAVLPTGCTEQQGPHLTVRWDTWFAETVCASAAERLGEKHGVDALVLPAMPFGPTPEHRDFGCGFVDIPEKLHQDLVAAALESLADQGFTRIVVWRGCGQHRFREVVQTFNAHHAAHARAFLPDPPFHDMWVEFGDSRDPGGHADSFTTSMALHLCPEHVREDKIADPGCKPVDWDDPDLNFADYSPTGVVGTPIYAAAELGAKLWPKIVDWLADRLKECADAPVA